MQSWRIEGPFSVLLESFVAAEVRRSCRLCVWGRFKKVFISSQTSNEKRTEVRNEKWLCLLKFSMFPLTPIPNPTHTLHLTPTNCLRTVRPTKKRLKWTNWKSEKCPAGQKLPNCEGGVVKMWPGDGGRGGRQNVTGGGSGGGGGGANKPRRDIILENNSKHSKIQGFAPSLNV